ncbi:MAG: 30S ribosomal protein S3 [Oscillospiraceae bacterium]|nr:30S ribosomal protein S3 [Oscillospiraceae bacterium]
MGQKVNPHGLRVGVIKNWDSRWFARDENFGDTLVEDYNIRKFLKKKLYDAGIPKIEIERDATKARIHIHCARPGIVIGKGGQEIEKTRKACEEIVNKNRAEKLAVYVNVVEVKQIDKNAQLVAENIAQQLENRVSFRRAMKQAIGRAMRFGSKGIKVQVSGRLGGAEIARTEHYHEGTIPLQTLRADIDYGFAEAATTYGRIGVKVWIYSGEVLHEVKRSEPRAMDPKAMRDPRPPRRDRGPRRDFGRDGGNRGPRQDMRGAGGPRPYSSNAPREGGGR